MVSRYIMEITWKYSWNLKKARKTRNNIFPNLIKPSQASNGSLFCTLWIFFSTKSIVKLQYCVCVASILSLETWHLLACRLARLKKATGLSCGREAHRQRSKLLNFVQTDTVHPLKFTFLFLFISNIIHWILSSFNCIKTAGVCWTKYRRIVPPMPLC